MKTQIAAFAAAAITLGLVAAPLVANADNDNHHHPAAVIHHRVMLQNARIRQGVRSGELNHRQAAILHAKDRWIQRSAIRDRRHNDGRLTPLEHARLERRLNNMNHIIARKKQ